MEGEDYGFISINRTKDRDTDRSTLMWSEGEPGLQVVGVLYHGCRVEPASVKDAYQIIDHIKSWIADHTED